jgi:hypothetical protein
MALLKIMDKKDILDQLESLKQQKVNAMADIYSMNGAIKLCEYWLKKIDEKKEEKKPIKK